MGSTQEVTIDYASGSAEQSTGGVRINLIPREGGNTFTGSFFGTAVNSAFQGSNFTQAHRDQGLRAPNELRKLWDVTDDLVIDVGEVELVWEGNEVYRQDDKHESIAWTLFKDGVRTVTFRRGAEEAEVVRLLGVINRARTLPADAPDDLLTLVWEEDFHHPSTRSARWWRRT